LATIRSITPADRDEWLRMRRALWGGDDHAREIDAWFANPPAGTAVFVAQRNEGKLAGFLEVRIRSHADGCESSPVAYIEGWYVDPDCRRRGIGRQLVEAAEQWARQHHLTEIASDCLIDNDISHHAHQALGYAEVDRVIQFRKRLKG